MERYTDSCPLSQQQLIDEYFLEHRTKLLDIAAFLDRMDRAVEPNALDDVRFLAFRRALELLCDDQPLRTERIQILLSDTKTELLIERDQQNAIGAPKREVQQ